MTGPAAARPQPSEIATALAAVGIDPREVPPRVQEMWMAHVQGATITSVGREFGMNARRVSLLFGECALPTGRAARDAVARALATGATPTLGATPPTARALAEAGAAAARLREMWLLHARAGVPAAEVAQRYGVDPSRLRAVFHSIEERVQATRAEHRPARPSSERPA